MVHVAAGTEITDCAAIQTAVGGLENRMETWGIDALVMGAQKCLAAPPGLSAVALSKAAYESLHADTSFYTNLKAHTDALEFDDSATPRLPGCPSDPLPAACWNATVGIASASWIV